MCQLRKTCGFTDLAHLRVALYPDQQLRQRGSIQRLRGQRHRIEAIVAALRSRRQLPSARCTAMASNWLWPYTVACRLAS